MFERVYTVTVYWDGPREGVADYEGVPHHYIAEWNDVRDEYAETYSLTPIDDVTLALLLEDWAIWSRWKVAFHRGEVDLASHPALPEDRVRYKELEAELSVRLGKDAQGCLRKRAEFRDSVDAESPGAGFMKPLLVRWYDPV